MSDSFTSSLHIRSSVLPFSMAQTQVSLQLEESLHSAQRALQSCDRQLAQLKMENDALQSRLDKCTELRDQ